MMKRAILLLTALLFPIEALSAAEATRPNILFIYTDDHSYRTISCYEHAESWAQTPNIDRLAKRGVRFTHAYIGSWCMPSRVTMLTGLHQYGAKTMRMEGEYPGSEYDPAQCPFWPAVLRQHGYHTAHIGKWHSGRDSGFGRDWDHQIVWNRPNAETVKRLRAAAIAELKRTGAKMVDSLPPVLLAQNLPPAKGAKSNATMGLGSSH